MRTLQERKRVFIYWLSLYMFCMWTPTLFTSCRHAVSSEQRDETLTTITKQALVDDEMNLLEVDVEANEGIVYLTGETRGQARKMRAEEVARGIKGVTRVVSKISLEP